MRSTIALGLASLVPLAGAAGAAPTVVPIAPPAVPRAAHTATALPDGSVLVAGGCIVDGCSRATATTELHRDGSGFVSGPRLTVPRAGHTATPLPGGAVLVVGGYRAEGTDALAGAEVCTAASCRAVGGLRVGRGAHGTVSSRGVTRS